MQTINHIFNWWYYLNTYCPDKDIPNGFVISFWVMCILGISIYIVGCFLGEFKDNNGTMFGPIFAILAILMGVVVGTLFLSLGGPIIAIGLIVVGIGYGLQKIGDMWREGIKSKEDLGTKALAELIKSDPVIKAKYDELMKQTPEI